MEHKLRNYLESSRVIYSSGLFPNSINRIRPLSSLLDNKSMAGNNELGARQSRSVAPALNALSRRCIICRALMCLEFVTSCFVSKQPCAGGKEPFKSSK